MATVFGSSSFPFFLLPHFRGSVVREVNAALIMDDDSVYGGYTVVGHHFGGDVGGGAGSVVDKKVGRSQERPEIGRRPTPSCFPGSMGGLCMESAWE